MRKRRREERKGKERKGKKEKRSKRDRERSRDTNKSVQNIYKPYVTLLNHFILSYTVIPGTSH